MKIISPNVSVVIPVKNEAQKISACLEGILNQTIPVSEIIVIDSGSNDGTQDIVRKFSKVKLVEIPSSEFNHGGTRNLGFKKTQGDYIVYTVGDARPVDKFWLENLLNGFDDEEVIAVCGQQVVPHEKWCNPVDWFRSYSQAKVQKVQFADGEFDKISPQNKKSVCGWDDVNVVYSRRALDEIPFTEIVYGEDKIWIIEALRKGKAVAYNFASRVYHYHNEEADYILKKSLVMHYFNWKHFHLIPVREKKGIRKIISVWRILLKTAIPWNEKIKWWRYNLSGWKARSKATQLFLEAKEGGEQRLDEMLRVYKETPPVPKANS